MTASYSTRSQAQSYKLYKSKFYKTITYQALEVQCCHCSHIPLDFVSCWRMRNLIRQACILFGISRTAPTWSLHIDFIITLLISRLINMVVYGTLVATSLLIKLAVGRRIGMLKAGRRSAVLKGKAGSYKWAQTSPAPPGSHGRASSADERHHHHLPSYNRTRAIIELQAKLTSKPLAKASPYDESLQTLDSNP